MAFSIAEYEAAIDKLTSSTAELSAKLQQIPPAATSAANRWFIPPPVAENIIWLANKMIELGSAILDKITELLRGAVAPAYMFAYSMDWMDIKGSATGVASQLKPEFLTVDMHWKGPASEAYVRTIKPQGDAATRIGTIADKTAVSLIICATASLAFYLALAVIVVKFIIAIATAIAAFSTAVFSWAGAALIVEEAGVNTALILTAVGALLAALGAQANEMVKLSGEAADSTAFPSGSWPDATPGEFRDATVADGDADWSFER